MLSNNYVKTFESVKTGDFANEYVALFSVKADGNIIHDKIFFTRFKVNCDTADTFFIKRIFFIHFNCRYITKYLF